MILITCGVNRHVSFEDFKNKVKRMHPEYEIISEFKGTGKEVTLRCKKCGTEFTAKAGKFYYGQGCPVCQRKWEINSHEEYVEAVKRIHPEYEIISEYTGKIKLVKARCVECGYEWEDKASTIISWKKHCPNCYHPKTTVIKEEFLDRLAEVNPDVELIGEFTNMHGTTGFRCKVCGHTWRTSPTHLVRDERHTTCPVCIAKKNGLALRKTHEEFLAEMEIANPNVEIVGEYKDAFEPIAVRCTRCGEIAYSSPGNLLRGWKMCHACKMKELNDRKRWTEEEWRANLAAERDDVIPLDPYVSFQTPIHFKCLKCDSVFYSTPMSVIRHMACPSCSDVVTSKGEVLVERVLKDLKIKYQRQKKFPGLKNKHSLRFDFYLTDFNVCIEYNGTQHYESVEYFGGLEHLEGCQMRDAMKVEYCLNNDILLHNIPYTKNTYGSVRADIVDWLEKYFVPPTELSWRGTYAEE